MKRVARLASFVGIAAIAAAFFVPAAAAFAQSSSEYTPLTAIPYLTAPEAGKTTVNPVNLVKNIYGVSIAVGAVIAVAMIIWAGLEYATVEAFGSKSDAKERWTHAIYGLLLLLSAYVILRTINVDLVNVNLELGGEVRCQGGILIGPNGNQLMRTVNGVLQSTPCQGVSNNPIQKLVEAANNAVVEAQEKERLARLAVQNLDGLKAEKAKLEAEIAKESDAAKITVLRNQIMDIDQRILSQTLTAQTAQADAAKGKATASAAQLTLQATSYTNKALSGEASPTEMIGWIQQRKGTAIDLFDKYAESLGEAANSDQVNKINLQKLAYSNIADQSIALIRAAHSLGSSNQSINKVDAINNAITVIDNASRLQIVTAEPTLYAELMNKSVENRATLIKIAASACPGGKQPVFNGKLVCE